MNGVVSIPAGQGELIRDTPERRVEILSDHETLNATWARLGPGLEGADLHVHLQHTDLFYVLEGELTLRRGLEDSATVLQSGMLAAVPKLVVHGFRNASDASVAYLNFHAPGVHFADYLRAMRDGRDFAYDQFDPPADGVRPIAEIAIASSDALAAAERISVERTTLEAGTLIERSEGSVTSYYVLDGEVELADASERLRADRGTWLQVEPNLVHTLTAGLIPGTFLEVHTS